MQPEKIENFINNKIIEKLSVGNIDSVIDYLNDNVEKYMSRESYIKVSQKYLLNNWNLIHFKKRYNTYYVIYSKKRIKDLEWIKSSPLSNYMKEDKRVFLSLIFKEKLQKERYHVTS